MIDYGRIYGLLVLYIVVEIINLNFFYKKLVLFIFEYKLVIFLVI